MACSEQPLWDREARRSSCARSSQKGVGGNAKLSKEVADDSTIEGLSGKRLTGDLVVRRAYIVEYEGRQPPCGDGEIAETLESALRSCQKATDKACTGEVRGIHMD